MKIKKGDTIKMNPKLKDEIKRQSWGYNVRFGKKYMVYDVYGSNIIFNGDNGNAVNGHGINPSRVLKVK